MRTLRVIIASLVFCCSILAFLNISPKLIAIAKLHLVPAIISGSLIVAGAWLLITLLAGRVYCAICPLGFVQDLARWCMRSKSKEYKAPHRKLRLILLIVAAASASCGILWIVTLFDPYSAFGRIANHIISPVWAWINNSLAAKEIGKFTAQTISAPEIWSLLAAIITLAAVIILGAKYGRLYCNAICPAGTLLGLISQKALLRPRMDAEKCKKCGACTRKCPSNCIDHHSGTIDASRCVNCLECLGSCKFGALTFKPLKNQTAPDASPNKQSKAANSQAESSQYMPEPDSTTAQAGPDASGNTPAQAEPAVPNDQPAPAEPQAPAGKPAAAKPAAPDESLAQEKPAAPELNQASVTRRTLLLAAASAAALGAGTYDRGPDPARKTPHDRKNLIIPPGGISRDHFLAHCTGCHLCVSACSGKVLRPHTQKGHFLQPSLTFEYGSCKPGCVKCSHICPAGAIKPITREEKTSIQIGRAIWHYENCLTTQGIPCSLCSRRCPNGAITMGGSGQVPVPIVDLERCIGCGACEYYCPARPHGGMQVEGNLVHRRI